MSQILLLLLISTLLVKEIRPAFVVSCAADADCEANLPIGSSSCDFVADTIYEKQTCSIGSCNCVNGYVAADNGCTPTTSLNMAAQCTNSPLEKYPYNAICRGATGSAPGIVACPENMQFSSTSTPPGCKYTLPVRTFGDTCNSTINWCDTSLGLLCSKITSKCACSDANALWRDGRCTLDRVYGDACQKDSDCSSPGGTSSVGMACTMGRCICQVGLVARVLAMRTPAKGSATTSKITYRLMCLNDSISAPSEPGQSCFVDPDSSAAAVGASPTSPIRFCWHDSVCHRCPGDPSSIANSIMGKCYKLANPPPVPDPLLAVFWQYFTSSTTTSTSTRPSEPSTVTRVTPVTPLPSKGNGQYKGKFGDYCWTDADCHLTAFCLLDLVNSVHPPCQAAICVCRHGNEPDTNGTCQPIRHLLVGDKCSNPIFEILPPGTACENGKVVCDTPRYTQDPKYDTQCLLSISILTYGQACKASDTKSECDSAAGLDCLPPASADPSRAPIDTTTRCWCSIGMWDGSACQVSDFGEICRVNTDCRGYPLAGIVCSRGLCVCQAGYRPFRTLQLILMQRESLGPGGTLSNALGAATLYRQTVCVNENTTRVSTLSGSCSALIDPRAGANLCRDGLFCFRCPATSDSTSKQTAAILSSGSCRTLNMLSATGLDIYGGASEDPYVIRGSETLETSTVGMPCYRDSECSLYQQCSKSSKDSQPSFLNSTYECQQGYCVCQPGYGLDSNYLCRPFVTLSLGQWCSLSTTNSMYPPNAGCYFGRVECNYPFVVKNGTCQLNVVTRVREYGESCVDAVRDVCRMPLVCKLPDSDGNGGNGQCGCADDADVYDASLAACRRRAFGEPCRNDTDCDHGGYASIGQAVCAKTGNAATGTCGCLTGKSYVAEVTRWNATSRAKIKVNVCLDKIVSTSTRSAILGMCTLRLVQPRSTSAITIGDQGGMCQQGLLCYQCPDDRNRVSSSYGLCRPLK